MFNWDASKFGRLGGKPYAYGTYGRTFVGSGRNKLQSSPVSQEVGLSEGAILSSMLVSSISLSSTQVEYWRTEILLDFSQFH